MGKAKEGDPVKQLADALRDKKGVPWRAGKFEGPDGDGTYVEFFRGKDLARYLRANQDKLSTVVPLRPGRTTEDQIAELMQLFAKRKLVRKADRKYKKPKPGKKRLVKFPRTLVPHPESGGWTEGAFYMWLYDRPTSFWVHAATVALPVVVLAACLFPLAPWWARMAVVYTLMVLLATLLGVIALRYVLFGLVWIVTGHSFWLFPYLMSDEVSILDAFSPIVSYERPKKGSRSQLLARVVTLAAVAFIVYVLYQHTPDAEQLAQSAKEAHDSILDYLDVYGKNKAYLAANNTSAGGQGQGQGMPRPGAAAGAGAAAS